MSNFSQTYLKISLQQRPLQATFGKSVYIRLCGNSMLVSVPSLVTIKCKTWLSHCINCYLMVTKFSALTAQPPIKGAGRHGKKIGYICSCCCCCGDVAMVTVLIATSSILIMHFVEIWLSPHF